MNSFIQSSCTTGYTMLIPRISSKVSNTTLFKILGKSNQHFISMSRATDE